MKTLFVGMLTFLTAAHAEVPNVGSTSSVNSAVAAQDISRPTGSPLPTPMPTDVPKARTGGFLTTAQIDELFSTSFEEIVFKLRDPFKMPTVENKLTAIKTDLEKYALSDFKLVGVLTGPKNIRAMLIAPDGKTYFAAEQMKIGTSGGVIRRIASEGILVREKVVNAIGQIENMDSEIRMVVSARTKASGKGAMGPSGMGSPGMGSPGMGSPGMGSPGMGSPGMGYPGMGSPR